MGQRTQLVLKLKDRFGNVQNKVYHEQWGFAKTMPMIILQFLTSLSYGSTGQKRYVDKYVKPRIVDMRELNAMSKEELEDTVKRLQETSVHKLALNSWDVSEEYTDRYIYERGEYTENLNSKEVDGVKGTPILNWDFDINVPSNVRQFTGDNNDGLALVSVEEYFDKDNDREIEYKVSVGFLVSDWYTIRPNSDKVDEVAVNRYHDLFSYTKRDKHYCPKPIMKAIATLYEYFDVEQLGKDFKVKKELEKV